MIPTPDTPPNITCIDFAIKRNGATEPEIKSFLYDPEETVTGPSLNDATLDSNQFLQALTKDATITSAGASISFDHGLRAVLQVVVKGERPEMTTLGEYFGVMADMMEKSGEFPDATPENDMILHVAALTGRTMASQEVPAPRP